MNKQKLLKEIFEYYGFKYEINADGTVKDYNDDSEYTIYDSIDKALQSWVNIMEETNQNHFETGDIPEKYNTWSKEQIEFIKNL